MAEQEISDERTQREREDAIAVPAIAADRFIIHASRHGVRIAFGERVGTIYQTNMHTAVTMNLEDSRTLADLLNSMLEDIQRSAEKSQQDGGQ